MRAYHFLSSFLSLLAAPAMLPCVAATVATVPTTSITFQIGIPTHLQDQQPQQQLQQLLTTIPGWTRATLEAGHGRRYVSAPITAGGKLVFANVTAGSYLGEVHCTTNVFGPLRVDVEEETLGSGGKRLLVTATETYRGNDWANRGEALRRVAVTSSVDGAEKASGAPTFLVGPLILTTKEYYTQRSTFNVLSLLKNPMILMALVGMVMMFGMPYMMDQSAPPPPFTPPRH